MLGRKCKSKWEESEENQALKILKFRTVSIQLFECFIEHYARQKRQVSFQEQIIKKDYSGKTSGKENIRKADVQVKGYY